jgi:AcrR family transcriptional regulator
MGTTGVPTRPTRRDLALGRVLDPIRLSAEERLQRFLETGLELMAAGPAGDFTVQEVVDRSGQSMRSFYQYFDGKYELMLAVFEDTVRGAAQQLRTQVVPSADPLAQLHGFVTGLAVMCHRDSPSSRVLVDFAQTLLTEHEEHAIDTYRPLIDLLQELLTAGSESGVLRAGIGTDSTAAVMVQVITFDELTQAISGSLDRGSAGAEAAVLWDLFVNGLGLQR